MYRMYNPNSGEHFYTASVDERNGLYEIGWHYEGTGWIAPESSDVPVFRLYNSIGGEHHYTMDADERRGLVAQGWSDEGVGWYSDARQGAKLYREYNPNEYACNHNYTADIDEHDYLLSIGWRDEGTAWCGIADDGTVQPDTSISIGHRAFVDDSYAAWALVEKEYYPEWMGLSEGQISQAEARARDIAVRIADDRSLSTDLERATAASISVASICMSISYGRDENQYYFTPYGVFVSGNYTCAGSTAALGRVFDYLGMPSEHVNRHMNTHQWNRLVLDGKEGYADGQVGMAGYGRHPVE